MEEKTVLLSADENAHLHTDIKKPLNKKKNPCSKQPKSGPLRIILFVLVLISGAGLGSYTYFTYEEQNKLSKSFEQAVNKHNIADAQHILNALKEKGYHSQTISIFAKTLDDMHLKDNAWQNAQALYKSNRFTDAYNALVRFTTDNFYHDRAEELVNSIKQHLLNGIIQTATSLYIQGNTGEAKALVNTVLAEDPSSRTANELLTLMYTHQNNNHKVHTPKLNLVYTDSGEQAYKQGDIDKAIMIWSGGGSKEHPSNVKRAVIASSIKKYLNLGETAYGKLTYDAAIVYLKKADTFSEMINIKSSSVEKRLHKYLTAAYIELGKNALITHAYKKAGDFFSKALVFDPDNENALSGLITINDEANKLYKKAYVLSNANKKEACRLYMQAMDTAQKGTDVYKKIKEHIRICE
ncbi:MAG: hypothetical protein M1381_06275 [Deltaproteobacteria bacterium]|nr:hypothetical protein [Deltaproteobacteria bacterium]MCL5792334.1 hypothetical protein [Deltaproteobacteria bacterium]